VNSGPDGASTLDDLRRIIRRIEGARPPRAAPPPIEDVVGGEVLQTGQGPLVAVRREYPLTHTHGAWPLADAVEVPEPALSLVSRLGEAAPDPRGLLFLDTETTGLAGGTGTYAFLVGAGRFEEGRFVVTQYFMRDFHEEPAVLEALAPLLDRATGVVTFNGGGFDLPLLETRFILGRRRWPAALNHVDLLHPARRVWAFRFEDCRLATLEREVLGLERPDDVAGAIIPLLYFDFIRHRRAAPLARVFAHNRDDVLSLAALLGWFARALGGPDDSHLDALDLAGLGRLWERLDQERAAGCYRRALGIGLRGEVARRVGLRLAAWEKRRARWDAACSLWASATGASAFDPRPWEELAKYQEHRRRDMAAARAIVVEALDHAHAGAARADVIGALHARLARLDRRLARARLGDA
jgi:uncharacterized protein YprB with RNaseH-like and TPR domain